MSNYQNYPQCIKDALDYFQTSAERKILDVVKTSITSFFFNPMDLKEGNNQSLDAFTDFDAYQKRKFIPNSHYDDTLIVNMIEPKLDQGPWIAGGAVRLWYLGQNVGDHDIDIWFRDAEQVAECIRRIKDKCPYTASIHYKSSNAITFIITDSDQNHKWKLQLIIKNFYSTPEEIIKNFDFSCTKLVTDGHKVLFGETTLPDINNRTLKIDRLQKDVIRRMVKYVAYGYTPTLESIEFLKENSFMIDSNFEGASNEYEDV